MDFDLNLFLQEVKTLHDYREACIVHVGEKYTLKATFEFPCDMQKSSAIDLVFEAQLPSFKKISGKTVLDEDNTAVRKFNIFQKLYGIVWHGFR